MTCEQKEEAAFFDELDRFYIHMPGGGGETISFNLDQDLLKMVHKQYPNWKEVGNVTSVPAARIPKVFLHNLQMSKQLEKTLKSTQKGDGAEKMLYTLFLESSFGDEPGVVILPNVNGNEIFETQIAKVEIDMVLIHQNSGVFIFNVKNVGGKSASSEKVREDISKHTRFVRMLINYRNATQNEVPIHTVLCNFFDSSNKFKDLTEGTEELNDKVIVFNKNELNTNQFSVTWKRTVNYCGMKSAAKMKAVDLIVARLITLNLIEGSLALIHEQMETGFLQSVSKKDHLDAQIQSCDQDVGFKEAVVGKSQTVTHRGKRKYILWTKDQIKVISTFYRHLLCPTKKGMRLLVTGCKGSGKTLLLVFLAKLVEYLHEQENETRYGNTLVCDGSFSCPVLSKFFLKEFSATNVAVYSTAMNGREFSNFERFDRNNVFKAAEDSFRSHLEEAKIFLCDEYTIEIYQRMLTLLKEDQHCVLFSSKTYCKLDSFETIHLNSSLRSTCSIANFSDNWAKTIKLREFSCTPAHNFEGQSVQIKFIDECRENALNQSSFASECVNSIIQTAEISSDLKILPVFCFISYELRNLIFELLDKSNRYCWYPNFSSLQTPTGGSDETKINQNKKFSSPLITLFDPRDIDGTEFGVVIILMKYTHLSEVTTAEDYTFFNAITRASTKLIIIASKEHLTTCDEPQTGSAACCLQIHQDIIFQSYLDEVCQRASKKPYHLFVGRKPSHSSVFQKKSQCCMEIPAIDGVSLYVGKQGCLLHIEDIYEKSHLETMSKFGVTVIFIIPELVSCPVQHEFYEKTSKLIELYSEKNNNHFKVWTVLYPKHVLLVLSKSILEFLEQESGTVLDVNFPTLPESQSYHKFDLNRFHWLKWKRKANEFFRVRKTIHAFETYMMCCRMLTHGNNLNLGANLKSAIDIRVEAAKICTNLSKVLIELAMEDYKEEVKLIPLLFFRQFDHLCSFSALIMKSILFAMAAIEQNVCWQRSYCRIQDALEKLRKFYQQMQREHVEKVSSQSSKDSEIKQIISGERKTKTLDSSKFWDAADLLETNLGDVKTKIQEFWSLVNEYKNNLSTTNLSELVSLRRKIGSVAAKISTDGSLAVEMSARFPFRPDKLQSIDWLSITAVGLLKLPVRFALTSINWDPSRRENYLLLFDALQGFENIVNGLRNVASTIDGKSYLENKTLEQMALQSNG